MLIEGSYYILENKVSMTETVSSENINNIVFIGTLSGDVLSVIMGYETISFTKRHHIFN